MTKSVTRLEERQNKKLDRSYEEKVRFWYNALITASNIGVSGMEEIASHDRLCLAKIRLLWRYHAAEMLHVHIYDGERFEKWENCEKIAGEALAESVKDVMTVGWSEEEKKELESFASECSRGAYDSRALKALLRNALSGSGDDAIREAEEMADRCIDYVRFETYSFENDRKGDVMEPLRSDSSEPPPDMDEFEYIDWQITH